MNASARRAAALKPQLERDRKKYFGKKGRKRGWQWVTREGMDARCMRHNRKRLEILFFGRRTAIVQDSQCRMRAVIRKSRRLPARVTEP